MKTTEFDPKTVYQQARAFGWVALALNILLLFWNIARFNLSHIVLNMLGIFFVWWTFKIIKIQAQRLYPPSVKKLCEAVDNMLTNMYDDGYAELPERAEIRPDVNLVERRLAQVRMEMS